MQQFSSSLNLLRSQWSAGGRGRAPDVCIEGLNGTGRGHYLARQVLGLRQVALVLRPPLPYGQAGSCQADVAGPRARLVRVRQHLRQPAHAQRCSSLRQIGDLG